MALGITQANKNIGLRARGVNSLAAAFNGPGEPVANAAVAYRSLRFPATGERLHDLSPDPSLTEILDAAGVNLTSEQRFKVDALKAKASHVDNEARYARNVHNSQQLHRLQRELLNAQKTNDTLTEHGAALAIAEQVVTKELNTVLQEKEKDSIEYRKTVQVKL
ncbi:MAG: hypothetical protein CBB78_004790, partial [Roseibacillus sp. TMED18]